MLQDAGIRASARASQDLDVLIQTFREAPDDGHGSDFLHEADGAFSTSEPIDPTWYPSLVSTSPGTWKPRSNRA